MGYLVVPQDCKHHIAPRVYFRDVTTPDLVSDMRTRMRKFIFRLNQDLILESKTALLIKDMDILRLVVHMQQVDDKKTDRQSLEIGRKKKVSFLIREVLSHKVVGMAANGRKRSEGVLVIPLT